jgi:PAS domain S-box-containing protein
MADHVRVLLIDDDEEDFLIVADLLAESEHIRFSLDWVHEYDEGLEAIARGEHDVYLLDYFIGARNGLDLLIKAVDNGCQAPIIFLTAHGNYAVDLKAMEAGASDYLVKGEYTAPVLERSIRYAIMSKGVEQELKQHRRNLEELVRQRTIQHAEARADAEKRANEAERRQAVLQALLDHIPLGIAVVDSPDLRVQALSRYAFDMMGISSEEHGRLLTDLNLVLSELQPAVSALLDPIRDAALQGKVSPNQELMLNSPSGEDVPVLVSAGPIMDASGNITGAVGAWRDISKLKQAQEELRAAHDTLELSVKQRTMELERALKELQKSRAGLKLLASQLIRAQEDERKRIAREMHDSIGSSLSAVKFCAENAISQLEAGHKVHKLFGTLFKSIEQAIDEARRIITDLRPSLLDDLGIVVTIGWFCRRWEGIYSGMKVKQDIRIEEDQVPENLKIMIFRIIQEAMNNSAKHSRAGEIFLSLAREGELVALRISDDGVGFNPAKVISRDQSSNFGLTSMRERAELSGGTLDIKSIRGVGTTISAFWKIEQP